MSDERIEKLEKSLLSLRRQVDALSRGQHDSHRTLSYASLACLLSGAVIALTATTWRHGESRDLDRTYLDTLWGLASHGWLPAVTLALLVVLTVGTPVVFLADSQSRRAHVVFVVIALLAAVGILLANVPDPGSVLDPEDYDSAPGRWLTLLGTLALAALHGGRSGDLR